MDAFVAAALSSAAELGHEPCFILGDSNQDPLPAQAAALVAVSGWVDLGEGLGRTTAPGFGRLGTRIDRAYANPQASAIVRQASLRWDLGAPLHAGIEIALGSGSPPYIPGQGTSQLC